LKRVMIDFKMFVQSVIGKKILKITRNRRSCGRFRT